MLLDDIETLLNAEGPYTAGGSTFMVRKYMAPDTPDAVIVLEEFPAGKPISAMGPSRHAPIRERAGLMVWVRSPKKDYGSARTVAETIYQKLHNLGETLSGRQYFIQAMHAPALKEQDRNDRWLIETNFLVQKERG